MQDTICFSFQMLHFALLLVSFNFLNRCICCLLLKYPQLFLLEALAAFCLPVANVEALLLFLNFDELQAGQFYRLSIDCVVPSD